ncbi:MAG: potassium transporter KtrB [Candidatus Lambdaproteobacteria bacterium RIFOXYD12_FULL_49_8]|uniref:Potassium transporter KtrB n=1 Tax=Candidatus Lambdaproteobacteria bacterium RIFOXYD2_FULL_50_16 TaxID=1817772 RepID=A0A1F6G8B5_9PROT|nr:MAG: potassium transporter KtrB [Candidatus Lambdaproteobacteria bacterium RIFOXYD2_FULL_50_16]OGG96343.1 MAG: potassium transporter KtrB [Candidatus Lambdaproteobacteria bacterium RIFOXYD12_FULL_49_8]
MQVPSILPRISFNAFSTPKLLLLGYLLYTLVGWTLLCLPWAERSEIPALDHLFTAMSALSTTGLTTVDVASSYHIFGQLVILLLIQLGGIGYMTLGSFVLLVSSKQLSALRGRVGRATFALPENFQVARFIRQVVLFTLFCETLGAVALFFAFWHRGLPHPAYSALFHSISAFCTAGFSLYADSFMGLRDDFWVNAILSALSLAGGIGFIVFADLANLLQGRQLRPTFTSKVILSVTFYFLAGGTILFFLIEPSVQSLDPVLRLETSFFQVMSASTTVGFNTLPIGDLSKPVILVLLVLMVFGASPAGTGGGLKSTTLSALFGLVKSTLKGRDSIRFFKRPIPLQRLHLAAASFAFYMSILTIAFFLLLLTEKNVQDALPLLFEAISALGTVGLSMGVTAGLSDLGKILVILLMLIGRLGFITFGIAISTHDESVDELQDNELIV